MKTNRTVYTFAARGAAGVFVAQVCNLLYRRFAIGRMSENSLRPARCKALLPMLASGLLLSFTHLLAADITTITVHADKPGAKVNPAMWGIFFEDINFGADGGLYAELVKNRSFEFPDALMGWSRPKSEVGSTLVLDESPSNSANPHY